MASSFDIYHYKRIMFELELGKLSKPNGNCPQCRNGDMIPSQSRASWWTHYLVLCQPGCFLYRDCAWGTHDRCFFCGYVKIGEEYHK